MKNLFMLFGVTAGLFAFQPADARGADFGGIRTVQCDKYRIAVNGTKYPDNKEYSSFSAKAESNPLRLTETMAGPAGRDDLWTRAAEAVERPRAVKKAPHEKAGPHSIDGNWVIEGTVSAVVINRNNLGVFFDTTLVINKRQVRWVGSGSIKGDDLVMKYRYVKNRPPGFEDGTMRLKVVNDDRIEGKWVAASGKFSDTIVFLKKKP